MDRDEILDWCMLLLILSMMLLLPLLILIAGMVINMGTDAGSKILTVIEAPLIPVQLYFGFRIMSRKGKFVLLKFLVMIPIYHLTIYEYIKDGIDYGAGFGV